MDNLNYQNIIKETLIPYTKIPYSYGDIEYRPVFDDDSHSYCLITLGWHGAKRIHGCLIPGLTQSPPF